MVVTIEHLHEMLGRLERELAEARNAMAELSQAQTKNGEAWWQARMKQVHERNHQLQPYLNQVADDLADGTPAASAEEGQRMMETQGICPATNLGSSGILEMREE